MIKEKKFPMTIPLKSLIIHIGFVINLLKKK